MPSCCAINFAGNICNSKLGELNYFWFYDPHGRVNETFYICQKHSNLLVGDLMTIEEGYSKLIKAGYDRIERLRKEKYEGSTLSEQRQTIRDARENGLPEPQFASIQTINDKIKNLYTTITNSKKVLVIERNRLCRFCRFPLKDPELDKDQIGIKFSNIDFKSPFGHRRLDCMMHTECALTWLSNKIRLTEKQMTFASPKRTGQQTFFSVN